ncbi:class I SAM-dependent methyltransferase [Joostella sp. CR20]|uniref:class I SAM-dependent methyltransferase n=1 Tax=Joostella sp. CR20 TaxID=2804312 RepID=UPI00313DCFA2
MKKLFKFVLNTIPRPLLIKMSYWARPLISAYYKGDNFTDPIDNKSYKAFLPYGYGTQRENVLAPGTLSLERHRLLWLYLKTETDFFTKPIKLLHFAPEQAFYNLFRNQKNLEYTTTDIESPLADVKADICNLPFEDNSYDVIFCNHVLEHIKDDETAMKELYRVLKPGGWGIFQIPQDINRSVTFEDDSIVDKKKRAEIFGQYDHVRVYGLDYFDRLRNVGFDVKEVHFAKDFLTSEEIKKYALNPNEILPVCFKPIA